MTAEPQDRPENPRLQAAQEAVADLANLALRLVDRHVPEPGERDETSRQIERLLLTARERLTDLDAGTTG
ncbi:hypothetical protein GA0115240_113310 [Streptomyces sp. DvalAA-14]|uniref:hypothetical protein n=1 Tax=unclassified Streptomyces TaxID=2593676 RepID=UPI00081B3627|nr:MULTISPECIES: hypothetical protein [unclassified Streptomyces]MYS19792.1 hypothetical protein [Streptomyces sp. SID4948]SCD53432.1 hypothetical protein GA0115240_113310 [Streptomyces sp. DvalAA-14]